jgi:hypothetical protein
VEEELPDELSAEDAVALAALHATVERELMRVEVDYETAASAILGITLDPDAAPDEEGWQTVFGFDADGLLAVLQPLRNGAGTAAFVAAFRVHEQSPDPPTT